MGAQRIKKMPPYGVIDNIKYIDWMDKRKKEIRSRQDKKEKRKQRRRLDAEAVS